MCFFLDHNFVHGVNWTLNRTTEKFKNLKKSFKNQKKLKT